MRHLRRRAPSATGTRGPAAPRGGEIFSIRCQSRRLGALAGLLLGVTAAVGAQAAGPSAYVLMGENGAREARVITSAATCPTLTVDGRPLVLRLRAPAMTAPLRPTRSTPALSKASVFDAITCEAALPAAARRVRLDDWSLTLPPAVIRRIVVIGDTGCRRKASDKAWQACHDPAAYPFARIAAAAALWRPQLVVHVGDYLYRENGGPDGADPADANPWGYGLDAWRADFFEPGRPLLGAAAWLAVRGNHESCNRAGQGWWRFLDPRPLAPGRDCDDPANDSLGDHGAPWAVPLGEDAQLVAFDSSDTSNAPLTPADPRWRWYQEDYAAIAALAAGARHTILVDHHPILAFGATSVGGKISLYGGNPGLQSAFGAINPALFPPGIDLLLSGHIHLWEALSFASGQPAQIVAGFSGTQEDIVPLPREVGADETPAPGAVVAALSSWIDGFGFLTLERRGPDRWRVHVRDVAGRVVDTCMLNGRALSCRVSQVIRHAPPGSSGD